MPVHVLGVFETATFKLWINATEVADNRAQMCTIPPSFESKLITGECFPTPPVGFGKIYKDGATNATFNIYLTYEQCIVTTLAAPGPVLFTSGSQYINACLHLDILGQLVIVAKVASLVNVPRAVTREEFTSADGTCSANRQVQYLVDDECLPLPTLSGSQKMTCNTDGSKVNYQSYTSNDCTGTSSPLSGEKDVTKCESLATDYKFTACVTERAAPTGMPTKEPTFGPRSASADTRAAHSISVAVATLVAVSLSLARAV
jgi:hypothetical protein